MRDSDHDMNHGNGLAPVPEESPAPSHMNGGHVYAHLNMDTDASKMDARRPANGFGAKTLESR
jgi:hypothetical protein